jgi:hypothetical protein
MADQRMRQLKWEGDYSHLIIYKKTGYHRDLPYHYSVIKLHGESELPVEISNVKFTQNHVTVFDFTGTIYCGRGSGSLLTMRVYEYPNGVIQAEIDVVPEDKP